MSTISATISTTLLHISNDLSSATMPNSVAGFYRYRVVWTTVNGKIVNDRWWLIPNGKGSHFSLLTSLISGQIDDDGMRMWSKYGADRVTVLDEQGDTTLTARI